jgi:hypothetical protein
MNNRLRESPSVVCPLSTVVKRVDYTVFCVPPPSVAGILYKLLATHIFSGHGHTYQIYRHWWRSV